VLHTLVSDSHCTIAHHIDAPGVARVALAGELDRDSRTDVTASLPTVVGEREVAKVVIDLQGTTYIDSSGINALFIGRQAAKDSGKPFTIVNMPGHVRRLLDVTGLLATLDDR
jgi:anti-sigma B factor antagonist